MAVLAASTTTAVFAAAASGAAERASRTSTSHRVARRTTSTPSPGGSTSRGSAGRLRNASGFTCSRKSSPHSPREVRAGHPAGGSRASLPVQEPPALSFTLQYGRGNRFSSRLPSRWQPWTSIARPPLVVNFPPPALPWPHREPDLRGWDSSRQPSTAHLRVCPPPAKLPPPPRQLHYTTPLRQVRQYNT